MRQRKPKPTQWHPLFAELLRPLLQDYFEVLTNVPVGDAPRAADIVLLRRTTDEPTPFRGLWRHLTTWNVIEFKGPTVSARLGDMSRLVEVGLGIHRRLNEDRHRQRLAMLGPDLTSFWYVVPRLGSRFLPPARAMFGTVEEIEIGLWRSQVMRHLVFLVNSEMLTSEPDSVPLHLLIKRSAAQERTLANLVLEQPRYWEWYASVFAMLHPEAWQEVSGMATAKRKSIEFDFNFIKEIGLDQFVRSVGASEIIKAVGVKRFVEAVGAKEFIEAVGVERIVKEIGVDWFLANLPPAELKKLKERLK